MSPEIQRTFLELSPFKTQGLIFKPEGPLKAYALFTHGYTSHMGTLVNWGARTAQMGIGTLIFNLPGHYLGDFTDVESFEEFTTSAHELFCASLRNLKTEIPLPTPSQQPLVILGGHSLGGLLAMKALKLPSFKEYRRLCIGVGLGVSGDENGPHIFQTAFYEQALNIRRQLVSPALAPEQMFPWIHQEKENLDLQDETVHLIVGEDDVVAGKEGPERLQKLLQEKENEVTLDRPKKLPHHMPELVPPHLYAYLKDKV